MSFLSSILAFVLIFFGSSVWAAEEGMRLGAIVFSPCIEPSASYLKSGSDEDKSFLASCFLLEKENLSPNACTENVEIYLDERSDTTRRALVDCLSLIAPKWVQPLHYRAEDYDRRPWHERILDRYPGLM